MKFCQRYSLCQPRYFQKNWNDLKNVNVHTIFIKSVAVQILCQFLSRSPWNQLIIDVLLWRFYSQLFNAIHLFTRYSRIERSFRCNVEPGHSANIGHQPTWTFQILHDAHDAHRETEFIQCQFWKNNDVCYDPKITRISDDQWINKWWVNSCNIHSIELSQCDVREESLTLSQ